MVEDDEPAGGDVDRGPQSLVLFWVTASVGTIIVGLRLLGRRMRKSTGWDDLMMLVTLLLYVTYAGCLTRVVDVGGMRHQFYLSPEQRLETAKWSWISHPFVVMGFATGKVSVGLLLLRVIWDTAYWRKRLVMFAMGSAFVIAAINVVLTFVQCSPVEALWAPGLIAQGKATCWPPAVQTGFAIFLSSWNILADVFLALLPVTFMYNLELGRWRKLGLCVLLGLSFTAAVFAAIKTRYLLLLSRRSDVTWETCSLHIWSASELFVIIVCGSVPPIKPVYDYVVGSRRSDAFERYGSGSGSYPHMSRGSRTPGRSRPLDCLKVHKDELELYRPRSAAPSLHDTDQPSRPTS
ncbi:uncharacterized protein MAM_07189 [Metarhizium album ARSEF 1941]|uniref:Integral membrane protein n=1 Tax=Metarhizium album (strain ARSEF 1941) TaxID=1081103 RepID=A0A0B2WN96_METAS|nr:uncharacterized protein MAM_07189 [Metarhizium album ARSEF 1941]KHN94962.1 integral membrane protein [Metarhizium album ARSEF 1941]